MRAAMALVTVAVFAACSGPPGEPGPAPAPDIGGTWTLTTAIQGSTVQGQLEITGEPGAYGGSVYTDATGRMPISSLTVEGSEATIVVDSPEGPIRVLLEFAGDAFTGEWSAGEAGGTLQGRRVRG